MQDDQDWVSENSLVMREDEILWKLGYDIEAPFIVQWRLFLYSAPTSLKKTVLVNDGCLLESTTKPLT